MREWYLFAFTYAGAPTVYYGDELNAAPFNLPDGTVLVDALNGGAYTVAGGAVTVPVNSNWGVVLLEQAKIDTPKAPVVDIAKQSNDVVLSWAPVTQDTANEPKVATAYEVHRSTSPYFTPGAGTLLATVAPPVYGASGKLSYTDASAIGNPTQNFYYKVLAINGAGKGSAASNHVGEFDFGLVPEN